MKFPSKATPYHESVIFRFAPILEKLESSACQPGELYQATKKQNGYTDVGDYLQVLDCLYALRAIDYDVERGVLVYAGRNQV